MFLGKREEQNLGWELISFFFFLSPYSSHLSFSGELEGQVFGHFIVRTVPKFLV